MGQSTGVWGTKWAIRLLMPRFVALVEPCSKRHDEAYVQKDPQAWNFIDWSLGSRATYRADVRWACCARSAVGHDPVLRSQVALGFKVIRAWGRMRALLWKIGVRY